MSFHHVRPERPCDIWSYSTLVERRFVNMVFAYDFWSGEPLFVDVPHFFVRRSVADVLRKAALTGFEAIDVETIKSRDYNEESAQGRQPEPVCLLKVTGQAGADDFGLQCKVRLIVSDRALTLLREHGLVRARVEDHDPDYVPPSVEDFLQRQEPQ